jgi:hypothetical protein
MSGIPVLGEKELRWLRGEIFRLKEGQPIHRSIKVNLRTQSVIVVRFFTTVFRYAVYIAIGGNQCQVFFLKSATLSNLVYTPSLPQPIPTPRSGVDRGFYPSPLRQESSPGIVHTTRLLTTKPTSAGLRHSPSRLWASKFLMQLNTNLQVGHWQTLVPVGRLVMGVMVSPLWL